MKERIGFIGIGSMGYPIAHNLLRSAYPVVVFDIDAARVGSLARQGAEPASSPRAVAARAQVVFLCMPTLDSITTVATGPTGICHGRRIRTCVNFSTVGPAFVQALARDLASHGIALMDCPITGGTVAAREARLSVIVSGARSGFKRIKPMLDCVATNVFHVGSEPGQAQTMKLVNNMLSFAALVASCEGFVLGVKARLDADAMVAAINAGTGRNSATTDKFPRNILPRTFDYGAKLAITYKDISLYLEQAEKLGVPAWLGGVIKQIVGFAVAQGGDQQDVTTLIKHYEKWCGVEVAGAAARRRRKK